MDIEPVRLWMITHQIRPWNVLNERVLAALATVKREHFVPDAYSTLAFADVEIPLACGQRMLKPILEGRLLDVLKPAAEHETLVIGTGSAYVTACLANLTRRVTAIDIHAELTAAAQEQLNAEKLYNVELVTADYQNYAPEASFDRILVTGSMPLFDTRLVDWLKPDGRLILTTGAAPNMAIEAVTRSGNHYSRERLFESVVPVLVNVAHPPTFSF